MTIKAALNKPLIKALPGFVIIAPKIIRNNKASFINSTLICYHSLSVGYASLINKDFV